jgi:hypothetical protein
MNLVDLITELARRDPRTVVKDGFGSGHSDRGDYSNAAFKPVAETTYGEMLRNAKALLGTHQTGWKGGEYMMGGWADVHIGEWGACGEEITRHHFLYWDACAANTVSGRLPTAQVLGQGVSSDPTAESTKTCEPKSETE